MTHHHKTPNLTTIVHDPVTGAYAAIFVPPGPAQDLLIAAGASFDAMAAIWYSGANFQPDVPAALAAILPQAQTHVIPFPIPTCHRLDDESTALAHYANSIAVNRDEHGVAIDLGDGHTVYYDRTGVKPRRTR